MQVNMRRAGLIGEYYNLIQSIKMREAHEDVIKRNAGVCS